MTISFPLTLPAGGFASLAVQMTDVVGVTRSPFSLRSQTQRFEGAAWGATITLPDFPTTADAAPWEAFLAKMGGQWGTVLVGDPARAAPRGSAPGTPVADTASSPATNQRGDRVLTTRGWTVSQTGVLLQGDRVQLFSGSATRLHMVLADADSDGSGDAALDIWPPLREAVVDGTALVTASPKGLFRLSDNARGFSRQPGIVTTLDTLDLVEAI